MTLRHSISKDQAEAVRQAEAEYMSGQLPSSILSTTKNKNLFSTNPVTVRLDAEKYSLSVPPSPQVRARQLLISQYQASPNLLAYIDAFMEEIDELTTAVIATYIYRYPFLAYGDMLDTVAELVGAEREISGAAPLGLFGFYDEPASLGHRDETDATSTGGRLFSVGEQRIGDLQLTDIELRRYIAARILINTQIPTVDIMYEYTDLLYGSDDARWELQENYATDPTDTCKANMFFNGYLDIQQRAFFSAVYLRFKVAGVKVTLSDLSGDIELLQL